MFTLAVISQTDLLIHMYYDNTCDVEDDIESRIESRTIHRIISISG